MAQPYFDAIHPTRRTGVRRIEPPPESVPASRRLWSLDWRLELPWDLGTGWAEHASMEEVLLFVQQHYADVFGASEVAGRFLPSPMTEAKRRFFEEMDFFAFRVEDQTAGVCMMHPSDWTTYYGRSVAILPQYRERHLMSRFLEKLVAPLRAAGVERIETDCSPANLAMMRTLGGQGWVVTGSSSSERWGVVLRHTKFLSEDAHAVFMRQYTAMTFSKRRDSDDTETQRSKP